MASAPSDPDCAAAVRAAVDGTPSQVEAALGRCHGHATVRTAEHAARAALDAKRWDNLAYLADFLADVTTEHPPTGGAPSPEEPGSPRADARTDGMGAFSELAAEAKQAGDPGCVRVALPADAFSALITSCAETAAHEPHEEPLPPFVAAAQVASCVAEGILAYAVSARGAPAPARRGTGRKGRARAPSAKKSARTEKARARGGAALEADPQAGLPRRAGPEEAHAGSPGVVVTFELAGLAPGTRLGACPGACVPLDDPSDAIAAMRGADEVVIDRPAIRAVYRYPLGAHGPSAEEAALGGWVFGEVAPDGRQFTRADLARAVSARYHRIYAEEERAGASRRAPGMHSREPSGGPYRIWGHPLEDLGLRAVRHDAASGLYFPVVVS
jgi:hypothetical protein